MPPGTGTCCCGTSSPPVFLCNLGSARPNMRWNDGIPSCFKQYGKISLPTPQFENDRSDRGSAGGHTLENASWSTSELTLSKSRDGIDIYVKYDSAIVVGTNATTGVTTYRHPVKELYARKGSNVIHLEYVSTGPTSMRLNRFSDDTYNGCFYPAVVGYQSAMLIPGTLSAPVVSISASDPGDTGWSNGGPGGPGNPCQSSGYKVSYYPNSSTTTYDYTNTFAIEDGFCTGASGSINYRPPAGWGYDALNCSVQSFTETNIEDWYIKSTSYNTAIANGSCYVTPPGFPTPGSVFPGLPVGVSKYPAGAVWTAGFRGVTSGSISGGGSAPIAVNISATGAGWSYVGAASCIVGNSTGFQYNAADGSWNLNWVGAGGYQNLEMGINF